MSGGVDSSVAAALLKEQGYRVIGLFMKNWEEKDDSGACTSTQDFEDVARVCDRLDVPYYSVNFVKEYWDNVFVHFLNEYKQGYTPNPDILCNREIKFKVFFDKAMEMGADFLATGHYCQNILVPNSASSAGANIVGNTVSNSGSTAEVFENRLVKGVDPGKDQTYFLYTMKKEILSKVLFPVGGIHKTEVRKIAEKYDLATKAKKDSTGICFIGERDFKKFLAQYVPAKSGDFRTLNGEKVGRHEGSVYYTLGQRRGLGLGGEGERWFVVAKDLQKNIVFVERGTEHPALFCDELTATEMSWVSGVAPQFPLRCRAKSRYRQADQDCTIVGVENGPNGQTGVVRVVFDQPQRAITPRQSVVFYDGDICLGGAMIERAGPSYHDRGLPMPEIASAEKLSAQFESESAKITF
jgi:tRNA-specific 2-thiouridylase